jgi:hypothetical protein
MKPVCEEIGGKLLIQTCFLAANISLEQAACASAV